MDYLKNYINGNYCDAASGTWIDNYNPSDGSVYAQIPDSSKQDVANAYTAAQDAFPEWSNTTIETRSKILLKIADLIQRKSSCIGSGRSKRQR